MKLSLSIIATLLLIILMILVGIYFDMNTQSAILSASVYGLFMSYYYVAQFCAASLAVRERFKLLNDTLHNLDCKMQSKTITHHPCSLSFRSISQLHNKLCDLIEIVNSTFTLQLVFVMISIMIVDIFAAYGIICEFLAFQSLGLKYLIVGNSIWLLVQCAIKFFMAHCGSSTTKEAERSLVIVSKLADRIDELDFKAIVDLNLLINQMRARNKNLENIFFAINYKLVLAVSGS